MRLRQILLNLSARQYQVHRKGGVLVTGTLDHVDMAVPTFVSASWTRASGHDRGAAAAVCSSRSRRSIGSTTRRFGGTGLGLFISRNSQRCLAATLAVSREVGQQHLPRARRHRAARWRASDRAETNGVAVPVSVVEPKAVLGFDRPVRVLWPRTPRSIAAGLLHADPCRRRSGHRRDGRVAVEMFRAAAARRAATTSS